MALGLAVLAALVVLLWPWKRPRERPAPLRRPPVDGVPTELRRIYTTHVEERMVQRGISRDQVEAVLLSPDRVARDEREQSVRFEKDFDDLLVKVWVAADPWPPVDQVVVKTTASQHVVAVRVPRRSVGLLIGPGGATIKRVQATTGTRISVGRNDGVVRVRGDDRPSVEQAVRIIRDLIAGR